MNDYSPNPDRTSSAMRSRVFTSASSSMLTVISVPAGQARVRMSSMDVASAVLPFFMIHTPPLAAPASLASLAADLACNPRSLTIRRVLDWAVFILFLTAADVPMHRVETMFRSRQPASAPIDRLAKDPTNKKRERALCCNQIYLSTTVTDVNV